MIDPIVATVTELLIAKGPDQPQQYRAIAEEIVTLVRRHDYGPPETIAPRWAATYQALKDGNYSAHVPHRQAHEAVMQQLIEELSRAEADNTEYELTFDLQWKADMRAIQLWQDAHPGNERVWPDRANMVVWLMAELDRLAAITGERP